MSRAVTVTPHRAVKRRVDATRARGASCHETCHALSRAAASTLPHGVPETPCPVAEVFTIEGNGKRLGYVYVIFAAPIVEPLILWHDGMPETPSCSRVIAPGFHDLLRKLIRVRIHHSRGIARMAGLPLLPVRFPRRLAGRLHWRGHCRGGRLRGWLRGRRSPRYPKKVAVRPGCLLNALNQGIGLVIVPRPVASLAHRPPLSVCRVADRHRGGWRHFMPAGSCDDQSRPD